MTPREQELMQLLSATQATLAECQAELARVSRENTLLRQKVDLLARRLFGSSSEQISQEQLEFKIAGQVEFIGPPEPPEAAVPVPAARRTSSREKGRPRIPDNLPVVEETLEPAEVAKEPDAWRRIGEEVSEQLDFEPGRFLRRRVVRPKYVRRADRDVAPVIAPLPERLQDRGLPAPGLMAQVVVAKYADHLPLYRQEQIFLSRYGVQLPRQTLSRWVGVAAGWLRLIYEEIRAGVMANGYVQIDETPIEYLDPGRGSTASGWLWACKRPGGDVVFRWETSRAARSLDDVIPVDFKGTIQTDGYAAYAAYAGRNPGRFVLAACWAHVRRKFFEALKSSRRKAGWILRQIQALYLIEDRLRKRRLPAKLRSVVRCAESRMIVNRIRRALERLQLTALPKSALGRAISYALGLWDGLVVFLDDGRVEIDNNPVENSIRPSAIGKKNWLFVGEADAGDRAAIVYTVIESCRRRGIDPYAYLKDVLTRLPGMTNQQIRTVTPAAWAEARDREQRATAA